VFKRVDHLLQSSSVKEGRELLSTPKRHSLPNFWVSHFSEKCNLDGSFDADWSVSNERGVFTFVEVLDQNRGSLIYVDVWASWCPHSIREYPALEALGDRYKDNVKIVNISIDKNLEQWKWAENKNLQFNLDNSYVVDSLDLGRLHQAFSVSFIPRYLLFGEEGNLIHGNAPKPGSAELAALIEKNLNNAELAVE
jgi:thiol-disulfide isomerase/thioredoxin